MQIAFGGKKERKENTYMTVEHPSTGVISPPTEYDHASRGNDDCVTSSGVTLGFVKRRVDGGVV